MEKSIKPASAIHCGAFSIATNSSQGKLNKSYQLDSISLVNLKKNQFPVTDMQSREREEQKI